MGLGAHEYETIRENRETAQAGKDYGESRGRHFGSVNSDPKCPLRPRQKAVRSILETSQYLEAQQGWTIDTYSCRGVWELRGNKLAANFVDDLQAATLPDQVAVVHKRFWEIDALRGVAVVMMIIYHVVYDLYYFGLSDTIFTNPFWFYFQRTTATLFIFLMGVSLTLRKGRNYGFNYWIYAKRGLQLIGWGLVISLITWLALGPALYIRFGILHFLGVSTVLSYPYLRWRWVNVALGIILIGLGIWLQQFRFNPPWSYLFWLGLEPANHRYVDFFPFVRWFGIVLIGIGAGNWLYAKSERQFPLNDLSMVPSVRRMIVLGRHTLSIYLLHQPVLWTLFVFALWVWRMG
jgi:uncharacterized membrane protein